MTDQPEVGDIVDDGLTARGGYEAKSSSSDSFGQGRKPASADPFGPLRPQMFVCLCLGVTSREVATAVESGASTSRQVASMCGAGSDCGRCRPTVRDIIASASPRVLAGHTATAGDVTLAPVCPLRGAYGHRLDSRMRAG
jgi:bacterioferritin-associated ferredoxin